MGDYKLYICILLCTCLLTGCWDVEEVDEIYLPFGIGIDQTEEMKDGIKVTFFGPTFEPKSKEDSVTLKGIGHTLASANQEIQDKFHHEINIGHVKTVIVSEDLAKEGISDYLEQLGRNPKTKESLRLIVCKDPAEDALSLNLESTPYVTDIIEKSIRLHFQDMSIPPGTLRTFFNTLSQEGIEPSLPYLELEKSQDGTPVGVLVGKIAVFQDDRMIGVLPNHQALGYSILMGNAIHHLYTTPIQSIGKETNKDDEIGYATMRIRSIKTKITPYINNEEPSFTVELKIKGDLIEKLPPTEENMFENKNIEKLQEKFASSYSTLIQNMLKTIQKEYKTDIIGFGRILRSKKPEYFEEERWKEQFPDVKINIDIDVRIKSLGAST